MSVLGAGGWDLICKTVVGFTFAGIRREAVDDLRFFGVPPLGRSF